MRCLALIATLLLAAPVVASAAERHPPRPSARPVTATHPAAVEPAMPQAGYGVIFAARAPGSAFAMVIGETSRSTAHRIAEQSCSRGGPDCRAIAEFSATCGAVAQGERRRMVTSINGGSGDDRAGAEADALAECRARDAGASCRIVAAQCGNRSA